MKLDKNVPFQTLEEHATSAGRQGISRDGGVGCGVRDRPGAQIAEVPLAQVAMVGQLRQRLVSLFCSCSVLTNLFRKLVSK